MRKQNIVMLVLALMCLGMPAYAQKKAETKLYGKTIAKPSVAAFDKFLKKYPSSVYADDINARKDTLLRISPFSEADAAGLIAEFVPSGSTYKAFAERRDAVDRIYAVCLASEGLQPGYVRICSIKKGAHGWDLENSYDTPSTEEEGMTMRTFVDSTASYRIRGVMYFQFSYLLSSPDGKAQAYVIGNYGPQNDDFSELAFVGKSVLKAGDKAGDRIAGRSDEAMRSDMAKPQRAVLLSALKANSALEKIAEADYLTDAAIEWWLKNNPTALTSASRLSVNILQDGCSLIEQFSKAKGKKSSSKYTVALIDTRGYTVIVAYQKEDGRYVLAWAEPECKNHYRDRLLNSISFEDANTLVMNYYQSNKTFKYKMNLSSKSLRR